MNNTLYKIVLFQHTNFPAYHIGTRKYADYTDEILKICLNEIHSSLRTQRNISEHYGITNTIKKIGREV